MAYSSRLELQIDSRTAEASLRRTERSLQGVERAGDRADRSMRDMTGSLDGVRRMAILASGAFTTLGIAQFTRNTYAAVSGGQQLQASLKTVTGSVQAASDAWEMLLDFAAETPFTLEQSVQGFIRMKSLGLDPTRESLRSFGNTASAMGKDMMQMVEAVADATTGEFERLKEFGIRASSEGENIRFTFQGVETVVRNRSEAINRYLQSIGENQFAGAMADQMDTLGGKMSNLQDSVYQLYLAVGDAGATDAFGDSIDAAASAVERLTTAIEQGALSGFVDMLGDANKQGNQFIAEIGGIIREGREMKVSLTADLMEIEASLIDMRASGVEAFAGLVDGAVETVNKGLIPIQQALNYLDSTFANLLENVGTLLGPAGTGFIEQAQAIRDGLMDPTGISVEDLSVRAAGWREEAAAIRESAEALREGGQDAEGSVNIGFKPLTEWLFELTEGAGDAGEETDKLSGTTTRLASAASGATDATDEQSRAYQRLLDNLYPMAAAQRQFREEMELLAAADAAGAVDDLADAQQRLKNSYRSTRDVAEAYATDATKGINRIADAADDLGMTFSSAFEDAVVGGNNLRDVMQGLAEDIARIAVREAATKPLAGAISSMIGSALGGSAVPGGFTSQIDTGAAFAIGQAHDGMHSVPKTGTYVLERGERVVTPETSVKLDRTLDRVQRDSGGNTVVQIIDQRSGGERAQVQETRGADGMRRIRVLIRDEVKAMHADGSMDSTMARNYGNRRRPL